MINIKKIQHLYLRFSYVNSSESVCWINE